MDGLLVIDKPAGPTSHDVVARARRLLGERCIGHTGTLDPAATGVLPLVIGRATRLARFLSATDKSYDAVIRLGISTDTYDADGTGVGPAFEGEWPSPAAIEAAVLGFCGHVLQQPPAYSAKRIAGTRAHVIARRGRGRPPGDTERAGDHEGRSESAGAASSLPNLAPVTLHEIAVAAVEGDRVNLRLTCSAGFYVRSLAHELGVRLGTGAHLLALRRTRSGEYGLEGALSLETAEHDRKTALAALIPIDRMLLSVAQVVLTEDGVRHTSHGCDLGQVDVSSGWPAAVVLVRLVDSRGRLVGMGRPARTPGLLHPCVVLG
jgi:tRNA pseudouridine55 synthase